MTHDHHLVTEAWSDYELIDSGENMKLERFGEIILARPETQAIWQKSAPLRWAEAHATFETKDGKGKWVTAKPVPEAWTLGYGDVRFTSKLTGFKHTGLFPEQAPNWQWLREQLGRPASVLNLFAYTGVASLVAADAGAFVTHVDASKQSLDWAHDNATLSQLPDDRIRWILDDALAFVKREVRRGTTYDGIILDPPAFGRGAKGEVWKIEEDLPVLLKALTHLLKDTPGSFLLLNGYAAGYAARSFAQAVESSFGTTHGASGELYIRETAGDRVVPAGIYVRFVR